MNQSMGDSVMVSRSSQPPQQMQPSRHGVGPAGGTPHSAHRSQQQRPASAVGCNRCRKPLSTTLFVCACDCVFCEECTYHHFHTSSNCPACQRVLSESDFMELAVADPSSTTAPTSKESSFQRLFTKKLASNSIIPFADVCATALQQHDDSRAAFKFLLKQLMMENAKNSQRFQQLLQAFESIKQEYTTLKQSAQAQKMRYETLVESTQQQLASANKKIQEKDHQIQQFQKLHQARLSSSATNIPHTSPGNGLRRVSTGSGGPSPSANPGSRAAHEQPPHPHQQAPPIQGFMIQKEAQERARQRALDAQHRNVPVMGRQHNLKNPSSHHQSKNPYLSSPKGPPPPPTAYPRPRSSGSTGSSGSIRRNLTSGSGYTFSEGSSNNSVEYHKRRRAMSPSQALASTSSQQAGSYGSSPAGRGTSNYFLPDSGGPYAKGYRC